MKTKEATKKELKTMVQELYDAMIKIRDFSTNALNEENRHLQDYALSRIYDDAQKTIVSITVKLI